MGDNPTPDYLLVCVNVSNEPLLAPPRLVTTAPPHLHDYTIQVAVYCSIDISFVENNCKIITDDSTLTSFLAALPENKVSVSKGRVESATAVGF